MRFESKLCHVSENRAIVQVTGWDNDKNLGSSLAEGTTVENAEDKAISRLNKRLNAQAIFANDMKTPNEDINRNIFDVKFTQKDKINNVNANQEPSDWSNELTAIDSEIERLKWSRNDEVNFLNKTFGYNNRTKITSYNEIVKYLNLLKNIKDTDYSTLSRANISELIEHSDNILKELSWDHIKGREFLQKEFNVSTRKELNEKQLISFVAKLKSILNK